jgi:hypothetical protein
VHEDHEGHEGLKRANSFHFVIFLSFAIFEVKKRMI